tara:strand:+ start:117 stop:1064 length:948 start_codon:yes stop_codon:yes gene_type:complete
MAYREKVFNANVLTDLLSTYLTHKAQEREKYYDAEVKADKPMIRQAADGYLYYADKNKGDFGQRVFPDVKKPPKTSGQGLTTEEFFYKPGSDENQAGQSVLFQKKGGQYFHADTGDPVDPAIFANLTKKTPSTAAAKDPKNLKTAFFSDGTSREFDMRNGKWTWLDTSKPVLNTEWADFTLQKDDRDEKTEKKTRTALKNFINKELRPIYNEFSDKTNFAQGTSWAKYPEMLDKEAQWIRNNFEGDTDVFTSVKAMKDAMPELAKKTDDEIRQRVQEQLDESISTGKKPMFILHETAFGNESDFSTMMENFKNLK